MAMTPQFDYSEEDDDESGVDMVAFLRTNPSREKKITSTKSDEDEDGDEVDFLEILRKGPVKKDSSLERNKKKGEEEKKNSKNKNKKKTGGRDKKVGEKEESEEDEVDFLDIIRKGPSSPRNKGSSEERKKSSSKRIENKNNAQEQEDEEIDFLDIIRKGPNAEEANKSQKSKKKKEKVKRIAEEDDDEIDFLDIIRKGPAEGSKKKSQKSKKENSEEDEGDDLDFLDAIRKGPAMMINEDISNSGSLKKKKRRTWRKSSRRDDDDKYDKYDSMEVDFMDILRSHPPIKPTTSRNEEEKVMQRLIGFLESLRQRPSSSTSSSYTTLPSASSSPSSSYSMRSPRGERSKLLALWDQEADGGEDNETDDLGDLRAFLRTNPPAKKQQQDSSNDEEDGSETRRSTGSTAESSRTEGDRLRGRVVRLLQEMVRGVSQPKTRRESKEIPSQAPSDGSELSPRSSAETDVSDQFSGESGNDDFSLFQNGSYTTDLQIYITDSAEEPDSVGDLVDMLQFLKSSPLTLTAPETSSRRSLYASLHQFVDMLDVRRSGTKSKQPQLSPRDQQSQLSPRHSSPSSPYNSLRRRQSSSRKDGADRLRKKLLVIDSHHWLDELPSSLIEDEDQDEEREGNSRRSLHLLKRGLATFSKETSFFLALNN